MIAAPARGTTARRPERQADDERREEDGRREEADPRARALAEVCRREGAVDTGADRARDDDDVAAEARHRTITSPSMSLLCRVQT